MPNSLKCKIKHLRHNGTLTERECDRILKALEQEPCEDCISRKAVLDMATTIQTDDFSGNEIIEVVDVDDIKELPPITPQQKIGHWINLEKTKYKGQVLPFWGRYECSKCGGHGQGDFNYCPNCGSEMTELKTS